MTSARIEIRIALLDGDIVGTADDPEPFFALIGVKHPLVESRIRIDHLKILRKSLLRRQALVKIQLFAISSHLSPSMNSLLYRPQRR